MNVGVGHTRHTPTTPLDKGCAPVSLPYARLGAPAVATARARLWRPRQRRRLPPPQPLSHGAARGVPSAGAERGGPAVARWQRQPRAAPASRPEPEPPALPCPTAPGFSPPPGAWPAQPPQPPRPPESRAGATLRNADVAQGGARRAGPGKNSDHRRRRLRRRESSTRAASPPAVLAREGGGALLPLPGPGACRPPPILGSTVAALGWFLLGTWEPQPPPGHKTMMSAAPPSPPVAEGGLPGQLRQQSLRCQPPGAPS